MNARPHALLAATLALAAALLIGCAQAAPAPTVAPVSGASTPAATNPCGLPPIVAPTPAPDPGYAELDPSTGLHMTGKMQMIELDAWRLRVTGKVGKPLELTYDELRCLPRVEASPVMTCPGFFVDKATWAGAPIAEVLALAGVQDGAERVSFVSADQYSTSLPLEKALDRSNYLAYEWNGEPLPRLHGFPLRVVIPEAEGNQWNKWIVELQVE